MAANKQNCVASTAMSVSPVRAGRCHSAGARSIRSLRTFLSLGFAATTIAAVSGCSMIPSHIHDEKAAALSVKLQTDFATYREDQSSLYDNMAANLTVFQAEEEELLSRFAANYHSGLVTAAPFITITTYKTRLSEAAAALTTLKEEIEKAARDHVDGTLQAKTGVTAAQQAIARLKVQVNAKKTEAKSWGEMVSVYLDALSKLPTTIETLDATEADLASLFASSGAAADALTAGKVLSATEIEEVRQLIYSVPKQLTDTVVPLVSEAPGISVRILELGLELAELEKSRAEAAAARLELRKEFLTEAYVNTRLVDLLFNKIDEQIASLTSDSGQMIIHDAIAERHAGAPDAVGLMGSVNVIDRRLQLLRNLAVAEWLIGYQESLLTVRIARADHAGSIAISKENDLAWQAVIASGIDGLVQYHKGGLTEEDVANVMRLAQSIALIFIAS